MSRFQLLNKRIKIDEFFLKEFERGTATEKNPLLYPIKPAKPMLAEKEEIKFNRILVDLVEKMCDFMPVFRRIRGDGNCFYRAFGFSYLELIFFKHFSCTENKETQNNFGTYLENIFQKLTITEYLDVCQIKDNKNIPFELRDPLNIQFTLEKLLYLLRDFCESKKSEKNFGNLLSQKLENLFNCSKLFDLGIVLLIRALAKEGWEKLLNDDDVDEDTRNNVKLMEEFTPERKNIDNYGSEAEQTVALVLSYNLKIRISLFYLEKNQKNLDNLQLNIVQIPELDSKNKDFPVVALYFRPGHYDTGYSLELALDIHLEIVKQNENYGKISTKIRDAIEKKTKA